MVKDRGDGKGGPVSSRIARAMLGVLDILIGRNRRFRRRNASASRPWGSGDGTREINLAFGVDGDSGLGAIAYTGKGSCGNSDEEQQTAGTPREDNSRRSGGALGDLETSCRCLASLSAGNRMGSDGFDLCSVDRFGTGRWMILECST